MMFTRKARSPASFARSTYVATAFASSVRGSMFSPEPGCSSSATPMPMISAIVDTTSKYSSALTPTRPTFFRSDTDAIPCTTMQKITGAIIMRISATNASPSGFSFTAVCGANRPSRMPHAMAISTCTYRMEYHRRRSAMLSHAIRGRLVRDEDAFDVAPRRAEEKCGGLAGDAGNVRREEELPRSVAVEGKQPVVRGRRLGGINIDRSAAEMAKAQAIGESGFVDDTSARSVD